MSLQLLTCTVEQGELPPVHIKQGRNLVIIESNAEKAFHVSEIRICQLTCDVPIAHVLIYHVHIMRPARPG
jgi:hypothetical protein